MPENPVEFEGDKDVFNCRKWEERGNCNDFLLKGETFLGFRKGGEGRYMINIPKPGLSAL